VSGRGRWLSAARFLPAGAWYALIFWFSSKTAAASGGQSAGLLGRLLAAVSPAYRASEPEIQAFSRELLSFFVRKAAHMFLYFMLALLLLYALSRLGRRSLWTAPALCGALAALDEYHQTLVPGRSGEVRDVLVDLCGALLALGLWTLVLRRRAVLSPVPLWGAVPAFPALAALLRRPGWTDAAALALAERFVDGFPALDAGVQAYLLSGGAPVLREALAAAECGLLGVCAWALGWPAGLRVLFETLAGAAALAALTAAALGTLPPPTAALLAGTGWALAGALWGLVLTLGGKRA